MKTKVSFLFLFIVVYMIPINHIKAQLNSNLKPDLNIQIGHIGGIEKVAFLPDGKHVLTASNDQTVKLWDIASGKLLRSFVGHKSWITAMDITPDGKYVITGSRDKQMIMYDLSTGKAIKTFDSFEKGKEHGISAIKIFPDGKTFLAGSANCNVVQRFDIATGQVLFTMKKMHNEGQSLNGILDISISQDGKTMATCARWNNDIKLWDIEKQKNIATLVHSDLVFCVSLSHNGKFVASAGKDDAMRIWEVQTKKEVYNYPLKNSSAFRLAFSNDDKLLIAGVGSGNNSNIYLWNVDSKELVKKIKQEKFECEIALSPDSKSVLIGSSDKIPALWDINTAEPIQYFTGKISSVFNAYFIPTTDTFFIVNGSRQLIFWDLRQCRPIEINNLYKGDEWSYYAITPDKKWLISKKGYDNFSFDYLGKGEPEGKTKFKEEDYILMPTHRPKKFYISTTKTTINFEHSSDTYVERVGDKNKEKPLEGSPWVGLLSINSKGTLALSLLNDSKIRIWDLATNQTIKVLEGNAGFFSSANFAYNDKYVLSTDSDGTARLWNIDDASWTAFYHNSEIGTWLVYNSDGYWDGSINATNIVNMVQGMNLWGIDQFATNTNRPDLIMKKLPSYDAQIVKQYEKQYEKRIRKLGVNNNWSFTELEVPVAKITDIKQTGASVDISFSVSDPKHELKSYSIFINDVPIWGIYGKSIKGNSNKGSESVVLSSGINKVEISCTNNLGVESYRDQIKLINSEPVKKDLYFLAFGVSKYQNTSYNLAYAHKDALDLEKTIQNLKGKGFENVYTKVLTNEQVTPDAIKASKNFVKNAKPDDTFILFIAGHGMHDKDAEANYYFLTSNADINNLKASAADFETIEDLMQGIPPRNKLFLMDACESGEIDEEYQGQMIASATGVGISSRGFKTISTETTNNEQRTTKRSYLYQKDRYIYNDLVRRSGAIVFSSSKGGELSYERSDIQNGLFTYWVIKALTTKDADKNNDGFVSTDELREYVSAQVGKASGDLQHPTVDRDNIYQKFGFSVK